MGAATQNLADFCGVAELVDKLKKVSQMNHLPSFCRARGCEIKAASQKIIVSLRVVSRSRQCGLAAFLARHAPVPPFL